MTSELRHLRTRVGLASLALVALASCSDDGASPAPSGASGPSATASAGVSESASESASVDAPAVEPATGPVLEKDALAMNLLDRPGWRLPEDASGVVSLAGLSDESGDLDVTLTEFPTQVPRSVDAMGDALVERQRPVYERVRRGPNRTVNGLEVAVVVARNDVIREYMVAGYNAGEEFTIRFASSPDWPEIDDAIDSMLASVVWK